MAKIRFLYLKSNGQIFGPLAASRILDMYKSGRLKAQDMISQDKVSWQSALEFFEPQKAVAIKLQEEKIETKPVLVAVDSNQQEYVTRRYSPARAAGIFGMMFAVAALFMVILCFVFEPADVEVSENGGEESAEVVEDVENVLYEDEEGAEPETAAAPSTDGSLQKIIQRSKHAVGVIIARITEQNGALRGVPLGTAWASSERSFVTNAHVVFGVRDVYKNLRKNPNVKKFDIIIALNESQEICLVEGVKIHPEYPQFSDSSDFAVLFVRDKVKYFLECASKDELYDLQQGDEIFYLGFPMEGLKNGNLNMNSPTATMQDGRISSISDTTFGSGNAENNILIRHNLPTVGGASGSPIFSASGKVIAILKGGNMDLKFDENGRYLGREPSAAQINFAIRIDRLEACHQINFMPVDDFLEQ